MGTAACSAAPGTQVQLLRIVRGVQMEKMRPYEMQGMLVRMAIAGLSLTVSIVILLLFPTWEEPRESWEISVWYYICLLQAIGGVLLVVGSLKANHWLFLPWLVAAIVFIYTLLYKTVNYFFYLHGKMLVVVIPFFYIIAGFWLYFLCDVFQDFLDLHRKSSPQIRSHDPNSFVGVVDSHSPSRH